ncbi:sensor histidine kinase [Thalassotalea fusca]
MDWINALKQRTSRQSRSRRKQQSQLIWLATMPCLVIAVFALSITQLSGYLVAFITIILCLLVSYCIAAHNHASDYQIRTLSNLIESMIHGDYSMRGRLQSDQSFQELLTLVNHLADTLSQHKLAAKESRLLLERILEQMNAMVVAVNEQGLIVMANASAKKLILNNIENPIGQPITFTSLGEQIVNAQSGIIDIDQQHLSGEHFLLKEEFLSDGERHQLFIVTNAERLLLEKERQAWQGLLRVLSHELNNSLTPIAAISQSMKKKLSEQGAELSTTLLDGASIINERANALGEFIASYSQLTHLPQPHKSDVELMSLIQQLFSLFPQCQCQLLSAKDVHVQVDKNQIEQVFINLIKNAQEAMTHLNDKLIEVHITSGADWHHVAIRDNGKGIANVENIFVPFYTTKPQGSGIGLVLCRQIMFNHNGLLKIRNRQDADGVEAIISLPAN